MSQARVAMDSIGTVTTSGWSLCRGLSEHRYVFPEGRTDNWHSNRTEESKDTLIHETSLLLMLASLSPTEAQVKRLNKLRGSAPTAPAYSYDAERRIPPSLSDASTYHHEYIDVRHFVETDPSYGGIRPSEKRWDSPYTNRFRAQEMAANARMMYVEEMKRFIGGDPEEHAIHPDAREAHQKAVEIFKDLERRDALIAKRVERARNRAALLEDLKVTLHRMKWELAEQSMYDRIYHEGFPSHWTDAICAEWEEWYGPDSVGPHPLADRGEGDEEEGEEEAKEGSESVCSGSSAAGPVSSPKPTGDSGGSPTARPRLAQKAPTQVHEEDEGEIFDIFADDRPGHGDRVRFGRSDEEGGGPGEDRRQVPGGDRGRGCIRVLLHFGGSVVAPAPGGKGG